MEWVETAANLVQSVGFPIMCVIVIFWLWYKEQEAHREETAKFAEAINNNTEVMRQLKELIRDAGK